MTCASIFYEFHMSDEGILSPNFPCNSIRNKKILRIIIDKRWKSVRESHIVAY